MKIKSALFGLAVGCGFFASLCAATTNSWTKAALPWGYWHGLASSGDGNVLIAAIGSGTIQGSIYVSTNSGATWALTAAPTAIWTSVAASEDGSLLFAAAGGDAGRDHIYFSTNSGASWTVSGAPVTNWNSIACSSDGTKLVAAAAGPCSFGPIFLSADAGATWTTTDLPAMNWWSVASSPDGSKLAAASVEQGVYFSTNSGATWRRMALTNNWIRTVTISADGQRLAAAALFGPLYVSADAGYTWTSITNVPQEQLAIAASVDGAELVLWSLLPLPYNQYASGIYFSTDEGTTWTANEWPYVDSGWNTMALLACSADGGTVAVSLGYDGVFTWHAPPPCGPVAVTGPAAGTNGDFALHGVVNPNRNETWAWFDWDTSPAFGNSTTPISTGRAWDDVPLNATLSGLPAGVAVYFRIAAVSDLGLSLGLPFIYQAPLISLQGDNPLYLVGYDSYNEPGATVSALPLAIATGEHQSLALKADRTVTLWGDNFNGEFDPPCGLNNVAAITAGFGHCLALKSDGTVVAWGRNNCGEINVPTNLQCAVAISAGYLFSLALKPDGTVVGWGLGATNPPAYAEFEFGQAVPPEGLSNVVAIAAGYDSCLALKSEGTVVGWGDPAYGGTTPPAGLSNVVSIAAGAAFGLALKSDGTVVGWGFGEAGQTNIPGDLSNVVAISAGTFHGLALKADGTVVGWGDNFDGEADPPAGLSNVVAIAAGYYYSLALKSDGTVVGWGWDAFGETSAPTNLICSLGLATASGYVNNYASGTYLRTYTANTANGAVGTATRTVIVMSALETRRHVQAEMMSLRASHPGRVKFLKQAIIVLNQSMASNLWLSDMNLATKHGQNVFASDANVLFILWELTRQKDNPVPVATLQEWGTLLAKSDRLLAQTAIRSAFNSTTPGGGYFNTNNLPKSYFQASNQLASGDRAAANHQYIAAVSYYKSAWKLATDWISHHSGTQAPPGGGYTPGRGFPN